MFAFFVATNTSVSFILSVHFPMPQYTLASLLLLALMLQLSNLYQTLAFYYLSDVKFNSVNHERVMSMKLNDFSFDHRF